MKKAALIIITLLTLTFWVSKANAQTLTFDRAYQDYQFNTTLYDQAYSDYTDAKNAYLANQTLSLKEDARKKTFLMLVARDQLMVVYLTALRTKISELPGLRQEDKNNVFGKLDGEVNFYTNHKTSYHDSDDLPTLFSNSSQSENQYKDKTSLIVNESLFDISLGQISGIRGSQEQIYSDLRKIIDEGVAGGKLKLDPFNHWLTDIDATDDTLKKIEDKARSQIQLMYTEAYSAQGGYNTSVNTLSTAIKPLSQLNEFLTEVVNYIKNQQ